MSQHEVSVVRISKIIPLADFDNLELAEVYGYHGLVNKHRYKEGDLCAFIEPDTMVPVKHPDFAFLAPKAKGRDMYRITVMKMRGVQSQGLIVPAPEGAQEGDNLWEQFGVERYEPQAPRGMRGGGGNLLAGLEAKGPEARWL